MKRILKIMLIAVLAIVLIFSGIVGYHYLKNRQKTYPRIFLKELNLSGKERQQDFKEICGQLKKLNSFVVQRVDLDALCSKYAEEVKSTSNSEEYGKLLVRFFAELHNGHTSTQFNRYKGNFWATIIDNRIFVETIRDETIDTGKLMPRDEIIAINGIATADWIAQELPYIEASTPEYRMKRLSYNVFSSYTDTARTFTVRNITGEKDVTIPFYKNIENTDTVMVTEEMLNDSTAYLNIRSMNGKSIFPQFQRAYPALQHAAHIIIDIRENSGGSSGTSEKITEYFIQKPQKACVSGLELSPAEDAFKGKVYLLIGNDTFSAAESFAIDMKESGNVLLIGEPTGGDTGNRPRDFSTSHGIVYRIPTLDAMQVSPQGFPMEGAGISPHHTIRQTAENYLAGKDAVMEFTLGLIQNCDIVND